MKPRKNEYDRADRKARVAQKNILREKRFAVSNMLNTLSDDEFDTKDYYTKPGLVPLKRKN